MMMQNLRKAGQTWLGKLVVGLLFGLLILSFGIWGIQDIFRGYGLNAAARVGNKDITVDEVRAAFQRSLTGFQRQFGRQFTAQQARAFGLDRQVVDQLVNNAALDARARELGLGIENDIIAKAILDERMFKNAQGQFSRLAYEQLLREQGLTDRQFEAQQKAFFVRRHLGEAVFGGIDASPVLLEAMHRLRNETRTVSLIVLPEKSVTPPVPDEAALTKFYEERKSQFRAPEYRAANILVLVPDTLAKAGEISDTDAKEHYERLKDTRFGNPEKRRVYQLVLPNEEEAKAVAEKIKGGANFEDVAAERKVTEKDYDLGTVTKAQLRQIDPAVAEAAFAIEKGKSSEAVKGRFGFLVVKAHEVEAGQVKPYDEVADEVKRELARERAKKLLSEMHDKVEDGRTSARPLTDIARTLGLAIRSFEAIDSRGRDRAGKIVDDLVEAPRVFQAIFNAEIGADTEPVTTPDGGYIWYEVSKIIAAADRPLTEVKDDVEKGLKADLLAKALSDRAAEILKAIEGGKSLADMAKELELEVKTVTGVKRDQSTGDISSTTSNIVFATAVGKAGQGPGQDGNTRIVFVVDDATLAPFDPASEDGKKLVAELTNGLRESLLSQYISSVRASVGVTLNEAGIRTAVGSDAPR